MPATRAKILCTEMFGSISKGTKIKTMTGRMNENNCFNTFFIFYLHVFPDFP